jgi:flagellar biosynthetic protein FliR
MNSLSVVYTNIDVFLLVLVRIASFIFVSPVFGRRGIPATTKIGLTAILSVVIMLGFETFPDVAEMGSGMYLGLVIKEALIGISISFITLIFFTVFYGIGQLADMQIGFNVGGIYDAQMQMQVPLTGNFFYLMGFLTFLVLNGASKMIFLIHSMYDSIPIVGNGFSNTFYEIFFNAFTFTYAYAVRIILPLTLLLLITQFILGVIIKFVPQMNVFIIGIPVKIAISLIILNFLIGPLFQLMDVYFDRMFESAMMLIRSLN